MRNIIKFSPVQLLSSPLHVATRTGHSDVVQHLLTSGSNINAKDWVTD